MVGVEGVLGGKGIVEVGKRDSTEGGEPSSGPKDETIRIQNLVHRIVHVCRFLRHDKSGLEKTQERQYFYLL